MTKPKDIVELLVGDLDEKKEYRKMMARVNALPEDYRFVFEKIQKYMWTFAPDGFDMSGLIELFESGAAEGTPVLAITGKDVAAFCDELIRVSSGYTEKKKEKINAEIVEHLRKGQ